MKLETRIKDLFDRYLADARAPDITGFVEQLFHVAGETETLACTFTGGGTLRFVVPSNRLSVVGAAGATTEMSLAFVIEHRAARSVMRMICARLGAICKERSGTDVSAYGDNVVLDYRVDEQERWNVSFTNTPDCQEFSIKAL